MGKKKKSLIREQNTQLEQPHRGLPLLLLPEENKKLFTNNWNVHQAFTTEDKCS